MKKSIIYSFVLLFISIFIFDVFRLTPVDRFAIYFNLMLATVGHVYFIIRFKHTPEIIKIWYAVFISLMVVSIVCGSITYHQSLFDGFVANEKFFQIGTVYLFYYIFSRYNVSFPVLYKRMIAVAWVLFFLYFVMAVTGFQFVEASDVPGTNTIIDLSEISKLFTTFIAMYWFAKYLLTSKYKFLFLSLLFLSVQDWVRVERFALLTTLFVLVTGVLMNRNKKSAFKFIFPAFFILICGGAVFSQTDAFTKVSDRFAQAFKIFDYQTGDNNKIEDSSTQARVTESIYAMQKFSERPVFGNGLFRSSEAASLLGGVYFYVSDIGVIGILYAFGVFGILIFIAQLLFIRKRIFESNDNPYQLGAVLAYLFIAMISFTTGVILLQPQVFFFYMIILELIKNKKKTFVKLTSVV